MKGMIWILLALILGIVIGAFEILPIQFIESHPEEIVLYLLLLCVGISVGANKTLFSQLKNHSFLLWTLPIFTIVFTLMGVLLVSIFIPHWSLSECLAVGSGFGYYSLSSILITQIKGSELGLIALLSNIIREVSVMLLAPWMVKFFGRLAPISVAGATSMDSTLPFIAKYSGDDFIFIAIFHGLMVDFSVPFLVSFFCSL